MNGSAVLFVLAGTGGYAAVCACWPYASCRSCDGEKVRAPGGKAWRRCGRCKGSGERLRLGAQLLGKRDRRRRK